LNSLKLQIANLALPPDRRRRRSEDLPTDWRPSEHDQRSLYYNILQIA